MVSIWMVGLNIFRHSKSLTTQKALPPRHVMFWRKCTYTYYARQKSQKSWTVLNPGNQTFLFGQGQKQQPPSPTTGPSYQPKRRCFNRRSRCKRKQNIKKWTTWSKSESLFNQFKLLSTRPGAQVYTWKVAHPFFNIEQFWRGQPPACQCWGGTPSSPGISRWCSLQVGLSSMIS